MKKSPITFHNAFQWVSTKFRTLHRLSPDSELGRPGRPGRGLPLPVHGLLHLLLVLPLPRDGGHLGVTRGLQWIIS